ncbi:MAG: hypothetical protein ACTHJV_18900 [Rhizobiaceae bacterium]
MIKFAAAAFWLCAVAIGAMAYSFSNNTPAAKTEQPAFFGGLDYERTGVISVPLIDDGKVYGYFLSRLVYTVEPMVSHELSVPADALLVDAVYSYLYGNPLIDFTKVKKLDLDKLRDGIRDGINKRVGRKLVHDVLVEQIEYLSKQDVRDNAFKRHVGETGAPEHGTVITPDKAEGGAG